MSKKPKVRWIQKPVDMRRLRKQLFGEDRLPAPTVEKSLGLVELFTHGGLANGEYHGYFDLMLVPQGESPGVYPATGKPKHRSTHRLFAHCDQCSRWIPVGRMQQHTH